MKVTISHYEFLKPFLTKLRPGRTLHAADRAAFASGTHLPQQVPTPSSRLMSRERGGGLLPQLGFAGRTPLCIHKLSLGYCKRECE
jgi:hypothetical protein